MPWSQSILQYVNSEVLRVNGIKFLHLPQIRHSYLSELRQFKVGWHFVVHRLFFAVMQQGGYWDEGKKAEVWKRLSCQFQNVTWCQMRFLPPPPQRLCHCGYQWDFIAAIGSNYWAEVYLHLKHWLGKWLKYCPLPALNGWSSWSFSIVICLFMYCI